ncbi:MAG TPA: TolC family protein, partial [Candidatus Limnocylindrales bacterium]|nr:TolC family protein [Candidatus Limnocylindrales bacterium]
MTLLVLASAASAARSVAQPTTMERVSFDDAIRRATERNPSAALAAAGILRAEALLRQARAATRLSITGNVVTTTLSEGVEFEGTTVTPRNQITSSLDVTMPLYAPAAWARKAQAADQRAIADLGAAEVRRQIALATADAYLGVIGTRRVVESTERARDVAKAHFDYARTQQEAGRGSLLNQLRAQQELSSTEAALETVRLAVYRAQEALGVLM